MKTITLVFVLAALGGISQSNNPFKGIGKTEKIVTLGHGQFDEEASTPKRFVRMGSILYDTKLKKVVEILDSSKMVKVNTTDNKKAERWFQIDPLAENYTNWSPYNFVYNNPISFNDPTGKYGEFVNENGSVVGNDGINDKKVYVIKTTQKNFDSNAPSAGISKPEEKQTESFITTNSGNTDAFKSNDIAYKNSVEIVSDPETRRDMVNIVNQDNGKGGSSDANNREYGGKITMTDQCAVQSPAGPVRDPINDPNASIDITHLPGQSTFHSHPSGYKSESSSSNNNSTFGGSSVSFGGTVTNGSYNNAPSTRVNGVNGDIQNATTQVNYVFARGNGTVYIYNNTGVIATIPQVYFVTPKTK